MILPQEFVERWANSQLREQQGAQSHFNELCELVGHKTPTQLDPLGEFFTFEEQVSKATGGKGRADVWYKGHFAWEYKGKHKDLEAAYAQLLAYRGDLGNPPLLVVCDFLEYRIYPQWVNTSGIPFRFTNQDLTQPETRRFITWLLESPEKFLELRQTELERREQITLDLANQFADIADDLRRHKDANGNPIWQPMQIARFLTKLVFTLFAEDVELLPRPFASPVMQYIFENSIDNPEAFTDALVPLFEAMDGVRSTYNMKFVPYFNGGIFAPSAEGANDSYEALDLGQHGFDFSVLKKVSLADWRFVNPTIFGTLFEGALDVSKRAQLGAHYTSESDIRLIVEPVLMQPLYRQWDALRQSAEPVLQAYLNPATSPRDKQAAYERLLAWHNEMMTRLETVTVLDPACGSGNFLYVSLRLLKDLEAKVRSFFEPLGLPYRDVVTPRQLYGMEKDEFAANLAKVVVWIGYLQWRYESDGVLHPYNPKAIRNHPNALPHPILKDKNHPSEPERIVCADAILRFDEAGKPYEPDWQPAEVIVGNPPFLGGKKMLHEMGENYIRGLRSVYDGRFSAFTDLVGYWFEKSRSQIEKKYAKRAGLLATNSISMGVNLPIIRRINETGSIFMAWKDRKWVLDGASVTVSMIGFDNGTETVKSLDGNIVAKINDDLTIETNVTIATPLKENASSAFIGIQKTGSFDILQSQANEMFETDTRNREVIFPYVNGSDIVDRTRQMWIIDFGVSKDFEEASKYIEPFEYVKRVVFPQRKDIARKNQRERWWIHAEARPGMRQALQSLGRYICTPRVSKHRIFVWLEVNVLADSAAVAIARDDDYFFGVLHSKLHEVWSLRMGTSLEDRPRYTPTTTFETFPFPFVPKYEDFNDGRVLAISAAAKQLHEERLTWLQAAELRELGGDANSKAMKERTLTNLYNALNVWRGKESIKTMPAAREFAPRLDQLHKTLDEAVCAAYGWDVGILDDEEAMLAALLGLNLERSSS